MRSSNLVSAILLGQAFAVRIIIPQSCFNSQSTFDTDFNYLYPWGSDHNGAARMDRSKVNIANSILTLIASLSSGEKPASSGGKSIPVKYRSGTVHAKEKFNVSAKGGYDFVADFKATTTKETWPAFWLTAVDGWPPEIDLAEWKGSGKMSFNTFNTSSQVTAKDVDYPNPVDWHTCKTELRILNGKDLSVKFYLDGKLVTTQTGKGFVSKPMWLISDSQMEGFSGSPGPSGNTLLQVRNLEALSYNT